METMEEFFAGRFALRPSAGDRELAGEVTFTPDLQGPPDRGHGGGVMAACLRVAAALRRGAGAGMAAALPLRVAMALKGEFPIGTAVRVEAEPAPGDACTVRLRGPKGLIAEATGGPPPGPPPDPQRTLAQWKEARHSGWTVPGTRGCLACGSENPRGLSVRLEYNDTFVWKVIAPQPHFRNPDGTAFWGIAPIILDEIGWWLGALEAQEFGVTNVLEVTMHRPIPAGDLLVLGSRDDLRQLNKRTWRASAFLLDPAWNLLATAEVEFAASRVYSKLLLPAFATAGDREALRRVLPKYAEQ